VANPQRSTDHFHTLVARRLSDVMSDKDLTQVTVARELKVTQQSVSRKITGETPLTLDELGVLAEFLGVTVAELLGDAALYPKRRSDGRGTIVGSSLQDLRPGHSSPTGRRASDLRRYAYGMRIDAHGKQRLRAVA
jgi:transcriptional regulator with XRE-family HTH domain